uniref:Uncharacterized protein n=1 Tax=Psilocybe cubensis TaxID=181762 RepID=A0A8H8CL69_PSICU
MSFNKHNCVNSADGKRPDAPVDVPPASPACICCVLLPMAGLLNTDSVDSTCLQPTNSSDTTPTEPAYRQLPTVECVCGCISLQQTAHAASSKQPHQVKKKPVQSIPLWHAFVQQVQPAVPPKQQAIASCQNPMKGGVKRQDTLIVEDLPRKDIGGAKPRSLKRSNTEIFIL